MHKEYLLMTRQFVFRIPAPIRFLSVGGIGLLTDLCAFTLINTFVRQIFVSRALSLLIATVVTWRVNRVVTFAGSGRRFHDEIGRYLTVTLVAQGISYATFSLLILTHAIAQPQIALVLGAAVAAIFSYNGHRLFSFAPRNGGLDSASRTHPDE